MTFKICFLVAILLSWRCPALAKRKPASLPSTYQRKEWKHWVDADHDCLNTRHDLLAGRSSVPPTVQKCKVKAGKWNDFYFAETLSDPTKVDIDHVVPLKHAHEHGAAKWSREQKRIFANDPDNLVITSRKSNRSKGANDFTNWSPHACDYACRYMQQWFLVKEKYKLEISTVEKENRAHMKCATLGPNFPKANIDTPTATQGSISGRY